MADDKTVRASEVLNWDYLVKIGEKPEGRTQNIKSALNGFAYDFTSTASEDVRDQLLKDLLINATQHHAKEAAEEVVECLANYFKSDRKELRKFAKQCGVSLKADRWLSW